MKAWRLESMGGKLAFEDAPTPETRAGSVRIRVEASVLMSYLAAFVEGRLPFYNPPPGPFTIGTNAIGVVDAVGSDVRGLARGTRVIFSSHFVGRENLADPSQILIGLTASPQDHAALTDWANGTLAEFALVPAETLTPLDGLESFEAAQLGALPRCVVPFGGLLRGRLAPGETLVVNGATGAYGAAAALLGLAMGAACVVAAGRDRPKLAALADVAGPRLATVALSGDVDADTRAIREAAGGGAHLGFDMIGGAKDARATLSTLKSLRRNGRLVLMGSMTSDLPLRYTEVMLNGWEILGQFMYPRDAYGRLIALARSGLLDLGAWSAKTYPLAELHAAMAAAAVAGNMDYVVAIP